MKKSHIFIKNAAILTITALILRTIGIFFRVYMSNKIGAEGMGLYQLVFSVYVLAATFASSGISTAVTRLVTDELARGSIKSAKRVLRLASFVTLLVAAVSMIAVFFGAEFIAQYWIGDMRAVKALKILCFSLPFMGISSCINGYFIARRRTGNPAGSQIFEQLVRVVIVVIMIDRFVAMGIEWACFAVLFADTVAEICSCAAMYIGFLRDKRRLARENMGIKEVKPSGKVMRRLMSISLPITGTRYVNSALRTVENLLVPGCLAKFTASKESSLSQFGMLKGMAMPILFFPASFLSALSTLLVPEISEAHTLGQNKKVENATGRSIHITLSASILISAVFIFLAPEIGDVIYNSREVGFLIRALAPVVPFMYLESVCDGVLKGLNQQVTSFKYSVIDSVLRIILIAAIVPFMGMNGFLIVMVVSNVLTSILNIRRLLAVTKVRLELSKWVIKPVLSAALSVAAAFCLGRMLPGGTPALIYLIFCAMVMIIIYCAFILLMGGVKRDDLMMSSKKRA